MRLPLFPLAAVLFPGTPLPLHIFEPRYRRMLADCLAGDPRFGIVPVDVDGEVPSAGAIGCVASIHASQPLPDGNSTIIALGETRFVLERLVPESHPYLVGLVDPFGDEPNTAPAAGRADQLRELFAHYIAGLRQLGDSPADELQLPADAEALSFNVAAAIELDVRVKRRLFGRTVDRPARRRPAVAAARAHGARGIGGPHPPSGPRQR